MDTFQEFKSSVLQKKKELNDLIAERNKYRNILNKHNKDILEIFHFTSQKNIGLISKELEFNKNKLHNKINQINKKINYITNLIKDTHIFNKINCSICMEDSSDLYTDKCGHILCHTCLNKLYDSKKCPFCKKNMENPIRLFLV